ncbi:DUF2867 domain-containing protein [Phaeobacter sp. HF9A]|uniref:DUF2867 domain-containing protein n=1 Tax=Phaeobacter sp. HF9A TaxID=2721561 RepID=UPI0014317D3F|nr:DUF2867 domain-containing protein [Phaeobacter sp. HF9A]NIZ14359.1 DUF2867 domain-containing protein [Phaeobacter sp. HF9A]
MSRIHKIEVTLPGGYLAAANWADAYQTGSRIPNLDASTAVDMMFGERPPRWILVLNGLRNRIVGLIGLKAGEISVDQAQAGGFPILSQSEDTVVAGFDDWHLDFRIVTRTAAGPEGSEVSLATFVRRRHWFGYLYIFLITPFHKLIVRRLLANVK